MLIKLIQESAEKLLLDKLEMTRPKAASRSVLVCRFSETSLRLKPDSALAVLKDILHDQEAELYFCGDGDLIICWRGKIGEIKLAIINAFSARYPWELELCSTEKLFQFFDINVQGEDLRLLLRSKLNQQPKKVEASKVEAPQPVKPVAPSVVQRQGFSEDQLRTLQKALLDKKSREAPEFLIVEDQDFSRRLLSGIFVSQYVCHVAKDARQAIELYAKHAPDLVFLDIELPDMDGHLLAALFKKHDPESYIVMVTGNNHVKDLEAAKANKVQGFIVKPYNRLKIMGAVNTFIARKKGS